ncbi:hypothetical protein TIFTF001_039756 [Ficus carica]|uniref:Uncharacterized protein n=1 Tax=Ficus carica TaxID=3494 RepID=A0AA88CK32_FICCA|nr:hypothetical protein TIFTF001_039756 [Ficus carica]
MSGDGLSVVTRHRRQHVRGSMAWTAGDLPGDTRELRGTTCPGQQHQPRPLLAPSTRQISTMW